MTTMPSTLPPEAKTLLAELRAMDARSVSKILRMLSAEERQTLETHLAEGELTSLPVRKTQVPAQKKHGWPPGIRIASKSTALSAKLQRVPDWLLIRVFSALDNHFRNEVLSCLPSHRSRRLLELETTGLVTPSIVAFLLGELEALLVIPPGSLSAGHDGAAPHISSGA